MITVFEDDFLKVSIIRNTTDFVTLCFTGIGNAVGGVDIQSEEFIRASHKATTLFIVDKLRSWGNSVDFERLGNIVDSLGPGKTINAIGNSMGGFLAILASKFIRLNSVVAFAPQYSVNKSVVPGENRWKEYTDRIKNWKYPHLGDRFCANTNYYIIAGFGGKDDDQLHMFPIRPNIHRIYFNNPELGHKIAQSLKADGILYDIIGDCFSGKGAAEIVGTRLGDAKYKAFVPGDGATA